VVKLGLLSSKFVPHFKTQIANGICDTAVVNR